MERLRDANDHVARNRLVEYCGPFIFHWAFRLGASRQDAVDFVQDVFVRLFEKLPEFHYDPSRTFRGWLFVLLKNEWLQQKRKRQLPVVAVSVDDLHAEPDQDLEEAEFQSTVVKRALSIMKSEFQEKTWKAYWALSVEGKSGDEVAKELGMTVAAAYKAKSNVLRRIREELNGILE